MPDEPRIRFEPTLRLQPYTEPSCGFGRANTSGLDGRELTALNRALGRLMAHGLTEREAKLALHAAIAEWLQPRDAAEADLDRLLSWR